MFLVMLTNRAIGSGRCKLEIYKIVISNKNNYDFRTDFLTIICVCVCFLYVLCSGYILIINYFLKYELTFEKSQTFKLTKVVLNLKKIQPSLIFALNNLQLINIPNYLKILF